MKLPEGARKARARKRTNAALAVLTLAGLCVSAVCINVLAHHARVRVDATGSGSAGLAPRTRRVLDALSEQHRIIVAADLSRADPRATRALRDVARDAEARTRNLRVLLLDTGSSSGQRDFADLLAELRRGEADVLAERADALDAASRTATEASRSLADLLPLAQRAQAVFPPGTRADTLLRVHAEQLESTAQRTQQDAATLRDAQQAASQSPDAIAQSLRRVVRPAQQDVEALAREARRALSGSDVPPGAQDLAAGLDALRDRLALLDRALADVRPTDLSRVGNAVRAGAVALAQGPDGLVGIDLDRLLPSTAWLDLAQSARGDVRRSAEELLASSLAALLEPVRPVAVLTHAETRPLLDQAGLLEAARARLTERGVDVVEWAVLQQPEPDVADVDPSRQRPLVFVTLSPESLARGEAGTLSGAERAARLATALRERLLRGDGAIVSLSPSLLPTLGEKDPIAEVLLLAGVSASTGTPLLTRVSAGAVTYAETDRVLQAGGDDADHPIRGSLGALPLYLTWCVPLSPAPDSTWTFAPLLRVESEGQQTWGEREWTRLRQTPRDQRAFLPSPPAFDPQREGPLPADGWVVAAAAEGQREGTAQRVIVVGSNDWLIDPVTQQAGTVDGRTQALYPGNLELLEAGVLWAAGQDRLLAQSATAQATPMIRSIPPERLRMLRWGVALGPVCVVLLVGLVVRGVWSRRIA